MKNIISICLLAAGASLSLTQAAQAAGIIFSPVSATASSEFGSSFDIGNTIDQSGLDVGFTGGVDDFDAYLDLNPTHISVASGFEWFTESDVTTATVDYNLGSIVQIDRLALWNEESSGIGSFNLLTSMDGVTFSPLASSLMPFDNRPNIDYPAEVFNFDTTAAQFVRFEISDCPQDPSTFNGCGIGEVAFSQVSQVQSETETVPEPATLLGMVVVLASSTVLKRRTIST